MEIFSMIIGSIISAVISIIINHFNYCEQRQERLMDKQLEVLYEVVKYFCSILNYIGEDSLEHNRLDFDNSENINKKDILEQWNLIERKLFILNKKNKDIILKVNSDIFNQEFDGEYKNLKDEVDKNIELIRNDIMK